ncbi:MAG: alpha/beta fold hydrolase [Xanthomonadales bacterium]|nr:alpha/beta fold hydrolase [Xanthomonadales bacterium]
MLINLLRLCAPAAVLWGMAWGESIAQTPEPSTESITGPSIKLEPCRIKDTAGIRGVDAECGTLTVAENPDDPDGRQIDLFVARVKSLAPTSRPDAFTVIQGGPGGSSIEAYVTLSGAFEPIRRVRDIILVDQRGTGRSNPLRCTFDSTDITEMSEELTVEYTQKCLDDLDADPRFYTTSVAVQDLEKVRQALGYESINVYGVSYGTRVALHYLRRFPQSARTVIIDGVAPADWVLGPDIALFGQEALDGIFQRCSDDPACSEAFGDISQKFAELQQRLTETPVEVSLQDPNTGEATTLDMNYQYVMGATRMFTYQTETASLLPLLIHQAHQGNYAPMAAQAQMVTAEIDKLLAMGMHNSVICAEDVPFMPTVDGLEDTYMGETQVKALSAICTVWPRGPMDEDFKQPVESDRPVLLLSGQTDPVTPPRNAERAAATLSNKLEVVVPAHGHGVAVRGCVPFLMDQFVEAASFEELDTSCVDRLVPSPFFVTFSGPKP